MTGGVELEHSHRLVALVVVLLTAALFAATRRCPDALARRLVAVACGLVGVQAALGGLTVILRLPTAVSVAHLATSMAFLGVVAFVATRLALPRTTASVGRDRLRGAAFAAWLVAFAQVVLGAVVRHTGAALACTELPWCAPPEGALAELHMAHRALGVVAAALAVGVSAAAVRRARRNRWSAAIAALPGVLAATQVLVGVALVASFAPLALVTLHHAVGALFVASLASITAAIGRAPADAEARAGAPTPDAAMRSAAREG
jgi:cytochrome c oxidase assembly protein subunit 15